MELHQHEKIAKERDGDSDNERKKVSRRQHFHRRKAIDHFSWHISLIMQQRHIVVVFLHSIKSVRKFRRKRTNDNERKSVSVFFSLSSIAYRLLFNLLYLFGIINWLIDYVMFPAPST